MASGRSIPDWRGRGREMRPTGAGPGVPSRVARSVEVTVTLLPVLVAPATRAFERINRGSCALGGMWRQPDDTRAGGDRYRFQAGVRAQFGQDAADVVPHSMRAEHEPLHHLHGG